MPTPRAAAVLALALAALPAFATPPDGEVSSGDFNTDIKTGSPRRFAKSDQHSRAVRGYATAHQDKDTIGSRKRVEVGPLAVVEFRSPLLITTTVVLVDNADKRALLGSFVKTLTGSYEELGVASLDEPSVETFDEYIASLERSDRERKKANLADPFPPFDAQKTRAELQADLGRSYALVLRYIRTK